MPPDHSSLDGIQLLNPLGINDADAHLSQFPSATIFHSTAWLRVLCDTYGYQPCYLAEYLSGRLNALLPLVEIDSWLTGRRGVSLPFTDMIEPICPNIDSFARLFQAALRHAKDRGWKYLECRGAKQWLPDAPASTSFFHHKLDLTGGEAALFDSLDDATRRSIRKADRNNLNIEFSQNLDALRKFYELLVLTRQRHGLPPQPFRFFAQIHRHILSAGLGWVVLATQAGKAVAGAVFLHTGRNALFKFGASDYRSQHLRGNNLVIWRAIQHYARAGYATFDFGRTSLDNEGLRQFKLGWAGQEDRVDYVRYDVRRASFVTSTDAAVGWHNHVFNLMPISLSRLAGNLLYRHLG